MTYLRSTTLRTALCCGALLAGLAAVAPWSQAAPSRALANKVCSSTGLRFAYKRSGVTYSVQVRNLTATGVSCQKARNLAGVVAKDLLHGRHVPVRLQSLKITLKKPCTGCAPNTSVTAKGSGNQSGVVVRFVVAGGA